ncbi:PKD domain-containing protein, partial [Mesonia aestuariivivens]
MKKKYSLVFLFFFFSSLVFAQDISIGNTAYIETCSGFFYDNGGESGTYSDNNGNNQLITVCADGDERIQMEFTSFVIASTDYLRIYDGSNINAPLIGEYTSSVSPGTVVASGSNTSGCLTFEFVLDGDFSPLPGWEAEISCLSSCPQEIIMIQDITPSEFSNGTYQVYSNQQLTFSSDSSLDPSNGLITYEWNLGNNITVTGSDITEAYDFPGSYTATLTATQNGCEYITSVNVDVADVNDFSLYHQFNGKYDFTMIGNTMNDEENNPSATCPNTNSTSATLNLEVDQTIEAAYMYWAGSGFGDAEVILNNQTINSERSFNGIINNSGDKYFFGEFADVTSILQNAGNGTYTVSGIDIIDSSDYCSSGLSFGGWSIVIIYEDPDFNNNNVSVYDGFRFVNTNDNLMEITLTGFDVIDTEAAKLAFLAWEGDAQPFPGMEESLTLNGQILSNALNPADNAFNSTNSFTGETNFYNMDMDVYDISSYINVGDQSANVALLSEQDAIFINSLVMNIRSELPDATVEVDDVIGDEICGNNELDIQFTVFNMNSTKDLPANTFVSFYANGEFLLSTNTIAVIPVDGSETQTITIPVLNNLPADNNPSDFVLQVIVDENNQVDESDDNNNEYYQDIFLTNTIAVPTISSLEACTDINGIAQIDLTQVEAEIENEYNVSYYPSQEDAENNTQEITDPVNYETTNSQEELFVLISLENCSEIVNFEVQTYVTPEVQNLLEIEECEVEGSDVSFDLTQNTSLAFGNQDSGTFNVSYYENQSEANLGDNPILNPSDYTSLSSPQEIFIRIENTIHPECFTVSSFNIFLFTTYVGDLDVLYECSDNESGTTNFNLTENTINAIGDQEPSDFIVKYYASSEDLSNELPIVDPENFTNSVNPQEIFVKVENQFNASCYAFSSFEVEGFYNGANFNLPLNLFACDNGLGDQTINLEENTEVIFSNANQGDFIATYYENESDALLGNSNNIINSTNYVPANLNQDIYVRISSTSNTPINCFVVNQFNISITEVVIGQIVDKYSCQEEESLYGIFNLLSSDVEALSGQSSLAYTVDYYASQSDLDNGIVINDYSAYENTSN